MTELITDIGFRPPGTRSGRAAQILQETLDEKGKTDKRLTHIAEAINVEATEGETQDRR